LRDAVVSTRRAPLSFAVAAKMLQLAPRFEPD
jgi:hypothetical protein